MSPEPDSHWVREDSSLAEGLVAPQAYNEAVITVQTYYRLRKEYGGLK